MSICISSSLFRYQYICLTTLMHSSSILTYTDHGSSVIVILCTSCSNHFFIHLLLWQFICRICTIVIEVFEPSAFSCASSYVNARISALFMLLELIIMPIHLLNMYHCSQYVNQVHYVCQKYICDAYSVMFG